MERQFVVQLANHPGELAYLARRDRERRSMDFLLCWIDGRLN